MESKIYPLESGIQDLSGFILDWNPRFILDIYVSLDSYQTKVWTPDHCSLIIHAEYNHKTPSHPHLLYRTKPI